MAFTGAILLKDVQGIKYDDETPFYKKIFLGNSSTPITVLRGELILLQEDTYVLCSDPGVSFTCTEADMRVLNSEEFLMLKAVKEPVDRLDAFTDKLQWGMEISQGASARVKMADDEYARCYVKEKLEIGNDGKFFKVEILVSFLTHH